VNEVAEAIPAKYRRELEKLVEGSACLSKPKLWCPRILLCHPPEKGGGVPTLPRAGVAEPQQPKLKAHALKP